VVRGEGNPEGFVLLAPSTRYTTGVSHSEDS